MEMVSNYLYTCKCVHCVNFSETEGYTSYYYDTSNEQVDNVVCTGREAKLRDCTFDVRHVSSEAAVEMYCFYGER